MPEGFFRICIRHWLTTEEVRTGLELCQGLTHSPSLLLVFSDTFFTEEICEDPTRAMLLPDNPVLRNEVVKRVGAIPKIKPEHLEGADLKSRVYTARWSHQPSWAESILPNETTVSCH